MKIIDYSLWNIDCIWIYILKIVYEENNKGPVSSVYSAYSHILYTNITGLLYQEKLYRM